MLPHGEDGEASLFAARKGERDLGVKARPALKGRGHIAGDPILNLLLMNAIAIEILCERRVGMLEKWLCRLLVRSRSA